MNKQNPLASFVNFLTGDGMLRMLNRTSDIGVALFVVVIIGMIIVPVSPHIIDGMIAINFTISIGILMVALYIARATQLSIFPSLLLLTTLFRLGIEIAATRQILLHANAGDIIFAFGEFVVGGNFVVGAVIFLIITIVQFIVVTKGAERVAEVAARFTLDAMPGKQMSIDADLRSGSIDTNKARHLRLALAKESQLYGAMDGAMKFVKGDVIAGIIIAVINIVGGLIIGIFMHGMSAMQAAQTYTLLSIGSGLIGQIPSLLIALTAGMVTTRVSSDEKDAHLGSDLTTQLLGQPKALMIASAVIFMMGWMKGFPTTIFMVLATGVAAAGITFYSKQKKQAARSVAEGSGGAAIDTGIEGHQVIPGGGESYMLTLPVMLEAGEYLSKLIKKDKGRQFIEQMIPKMRHALYQDLGIRFPGVHVRTDSPTLASDEYAIYLHEVPILRGKMHENALLTAEAEETLSRYNIPYTASKNAIGQATLWIDDKYKDVMTKAGIKFWYPLDVVILHLSYFYKSHASEFLGIQEARSILEFVEKSYPDLVKEVTRLIPLQKLTDIFKRLVEEEVSIKDLRTIMEALSDWAQTEKDTVLLTEYVRSSLKRYISYKYTQGQSVLPVYVLDTEIEDMVRNAIKQTSSGSYLALDPDAAQMILAAMRSMITPTPSGRQQPVVLTAIDVRRFTKKLIESEFPDIPVISHQEVVPEIKIQPLGRIQLS